MGLANVLCEFDYTMYLVNGTSQCALGIRLSNVHWEWDYTMCPGNETIQCAM